MSEQKKSVYKPRPVSGFPEWLPEVRLVEQQWFDHIRAVFESYGFCSIETPSVEELDVLTAKGEVDKEIYVIERLHKDDGDKKEARLALHFDQTVPLARYVAQNFNELVFPFKRYQMQRVWRGERPQAGRFREFYQCDIDVINVDALPLHFDAELPAVMWEILTGLPGMADEKIQIRISNRKILMGYLQVFFGHSETPLFDISAAFRVLDKIEKMGRDKVAELLKNEIGMPDEAISSVLDTVITKASPANFEQNFAHIPARNPMMEEGIEELRSVMQALQHLPDGAVIADLSIIRGLDYYTGTVYETTFLDKQDYGSICSGGRYDDLASQYINKKLPGVGISIGFSRLFAYLHEKGKLPVGRKSPADILVCIPSEDRRALAASTSQSLRQRALR